MDREYLASLEGVQALLDSLPTPTPPVPPCKVQDEKTVMWVLDHKRRTLYDPYGLGLVQATEWFGRGEYACTYPPIHEGLRC